MLPYCTPRKQTPGLGTAGPHLQTLLLDPSQEQMFLACFPRVQDATTSTRQDTAFTTTARGKPPPWQVNSPWEGREQGTKETALQERNKPWSEQDDLTTEMNFCLQNTLSLQLESLTIKPESHPRTGPCGVSLRS